MTLSDPTSPDSHDSDLNELDRGASYRGLVVGEVMSRSGVGVLYLATRGDERCYLRVLDAARIDTDELMVAKADLEKLKEVVHRNVARVVDGEVVDGELHYTLEAQGTTSLLDLVRAGRPLDEPELVWVGRGLAAGLAALHAAGLHHGGLTPSVILVTHHGAILVDLGWSDRFGSAEQLPLGQAQRADLIALGESLRFAASPGGEAKLGDELSALLARLGLDSKEAFQDAEEAAGAFKAFGQTLGLPDPMAPSSLRDLLGRAGGDPLEASQEIDGLAFSQDGETTPLVTPASTDLSPLMASTVVEDPGAKEINSDSASDFGSASEMTVLGGPPIESEASEEALASEDQRRDTLDYARQALEDSDEISETELMTESATEDGPDSERAERGDAPALGPFGQYELVRELEARPTSTCFVATHADQPKGLVVEVLVPAALPGETQQRRFLRGAETAQAVQVEGIARVLGAGKVKDWCFVAYERTASPTLAEFLAEGDHASGQAPQIMAEALRLLEQAHHQGVVHGAIEPETIHVGAGSGGSSNASAGAVTLSGFGFGRLPPHSRLATRYYTDSREERDEAGDLGALARIFYEALTGQSPAQAQVPFGLTSPPPPSVARPDLAPALDAICLTALGVNGPPYASLGDFADDLEHLSHAPRHARPLDTRTRVGLAFARGGLPLVLVLLLAALGTVLAGVGASSLLRSEAQVAAAPSPGTSPTGTSAELTRVRDQLRKAKQDQATRGAELVRVREEVSGLKSDEAKRIAEEALRLVELGESDLAGGAPDSAQRAFNAALRLVPKHARALLGLKEAKQGARRAAEQAAERRRAEGAQDHEEPVEGNPRALQALRAAEGHLQAGRYEDARRQLLEALAGGEVSARGLLDRVRDEAARSVLAARKKRAEALVAEGRVLMREGRRDRARARFLDALALNPQESEAREGLKTTLVTAKGTAATVNDDANRRRRAASLEAAQRHASRARDLYLAQRNYEGAIDAYFQSLHHYGRADALDPSMPAAGEETQALLLEFSSILRQEGESSFAALLLRFYGLDAAKTPHKDPPRDAFLLVQEADALQIRRTFGGPVRFLPGKRFDALRDWIKAKGKRFQVRILIKTRIGAERPPSLYATALWVRVEDREQKTLTAPIKVEFEDGPFQRIVRVDARGRVVLPWDRSQGLKAAPLAQRVILAAKGAITAKLKNSK